MKFELKNLTCGYANRPTTKFPDMTLPQTGLLAVLGANGSGKTTLLKTLCGLIAAHEGSVTIDGKPILENSFLRRPLWISTEIDWDAQLTVSDIFDLYEVNEDATRSFTQEFGVSHLFQRKLSELSSGEKRRLALVIALTHPSPILLLDEPTNFLEYKARAQIAAHLEKLSEKKLILFSTHEIEWLTLLPSTRAWVLNGQGSFYALETTEELVENTKLVPIFGGIFYLASRSLSPARKILYFEPESQSIRRDAP